MDDSRADSSVHRFRNDGSDAISGRRLVAGHRNSCFVFAYALVTHSKVIYGVVICLFVLKKDLDCSQLTATCEMSSLAKKLFSFLHSVCGATVIVSTMNRDMNFTCWSCEPFVQQKQK